MTDTYREACEKIYIENIQLKKELEKYRKAVEVLRWANSEYCDHEESVSFYDSRGVTVARQAEAKVEEILK